jgi:Aldo/keto reductase family
LIDLLLDKFCRLDDREVRIADDFGCDCIGIQYQQGLKDLLPASDQVIFDTAESYGPRTSEERYGKYLTPKYRDQIFLMTKSTAKDAKTAKEHHEGSLKRLRTDRLDLWQVHSLM